MSLLELQGVHKAFDGVNALKPLSLDLRAGETLGIVGENGAGKSTLIRILSGVHRPDGGTVLWNGQAVAFRNPQDALEAGIATMHQELAYFAHLSVAENLLLGEPWPRHRWGGVNWGELYRIAAKQMAAFDLTISPQQLLHKLSTAEKQEIAIARSLARRARLLILDEPTASLSEPEVNRLFACVQKLRAEGVAVIYVSHRLDEILRLTDRVIVLRDGSVAGRHVTAETSLNQIVRDMVGRPLDQVYPRARGASLGGPLLELRGFTRPGLFHDISLSLRAGEIVGLAGLVGAGRSELARAIYGLYPASSGEMRLRGQPWSPAHPRESLRAGLVYLPEERKRHGLVADHSVARAIGIGFSDRLARWGRVPPDRERERIRQAMTRHDVRAASPDQDVRALSGGNQQKALLARWLERDPSIILLDEPTRGVDIGAKAEIHALIDRLAGAGRAVLLISSDLPEVLGMSDRLLVMHRGAITAEFTGADMTQENVIRAASGYNAIA